MKRKLSARETFMLIILGVACVAAGYYLLFFRPVTSDRDKCLGEVEDYQIRIQAAENKLVEKTRMQAELDELFKDADALSIPDYDNQKPVMRELNKILAVTDEYSLKFGKIVVDGSIVRRNINVNFSANDYESAMSVLEALNKNKFRCMLGDMNLTFDKGGRVSVAGNILFFEYKNPNSTVEVKQQ